MAPPRPPRPPRGEAPVALAARPAVLVVDDEAAVVELLSAYLESPDVEVLTSTDPREGLRLLERHHPRVALVDLKMPGTDGLEFVRRGRVLSQDTVFLMMTGYASMESVVDALKSGIHDYLTKPFTSRKSVQLIVRNALSHAELQASLLIQARMTAALLDMGTRDLDPGDPGHLVRRLGDAVRQVTDAPVVALGILDAGVLRVQVDTHLALTEEARSHLTDRLAAMVRDAGGDTPSPFRIRLEPEEFPPAEGTPRVPDLGTLLTGTVRSLEGLLAAVAVAHPKPAAFSDLAMRMTQALCNHASILAQARQASLQGERRKIASILWNLTDGIVLMDQAGLPEYMNPRAAAMLGLSLGHPPGPREFRERLMALDPRLPDLVARPGALDEEPLVLEVSAPEGPLFFEVRTHGLSIPGQPPQWMIVFGNITRVKQESERIRQLNEQLARRGRELTERNQDLTRVNRELDSFAYIASHDLQEPFRHIEIFTQFLENDLGKGLGRETAYLLEQIRRNTGIASQLLTDLRTLSRVTRTRNPYRLTRLEDVVREVLGRFEYTIASAAAQVTVGSLPSVVCDPMKIGEVFHNLVSNALKYTDKDRPALDIGARSEEEADILWVRDNGIGIAAKYHEHIFEPCRRIPFRDTVQGTGLGLTISRKIVEEHGGRLWVESTPGEGATFLLSLPRRELPEEPPEDTADTLVE
ncbi:MAG: response regulator, partial [Deltaproteobacteria bacterium]|nr:response regulator [Deltaproteobacteria bacterium]